MSLTIIQEIKNLTFSINMATEEIKNHLKNTNRPTTHYIWHIVGDNHVRSRHKNLKLDSMISHFQHHIKY